jgi:hypothetical protein
MFKNLLTKKTPGLGGFPGELHQTFEGNNTNSKQLFQKIEKAGIPPRLILQICFILISKLDKDVTRKLAI